MKSNQAIGIFDSGVGGLTVLKELVEQMPYENFVYLADSAHCPYGSKSQTEIIRLSKQNTEFLLSKNCKIIVVACNTATAAAIETLRYNYNLSFIGMEPAVKPAAETTVTGKIGILATQGTIAGSLFKNTSEKFASNIDQIIQVGEGLVELVEADKYNSEAAEQLLAKYIKPMIRENVDHIVLGCTHYPFFTPLINKLTQHTIKVVNPAPAIARRTQHVLELENNLQKNMTKTGTIKFYNSGDLGTLKVLANKLFPQVATIFKQINLDTN